MLARKSLLIFLVNLIGAPLGVAALFFVGRYMGPGPLGAWGFATAIVSIFSLLGSLGFHSAHLKRISEGQDLGTCLATYTWIQVGLAAGFVLFVLIGAGLWDHLQGFTDTSLGIVTVAALYVGFNLLRLIPQQTFDALQLTSRSQLLIFSDNIVRTGFVILGALLFGFLNEVSTPFPDLFRILTRFLNLQGPIDSITGGLLIGAAYTLAMATSLVIGIYLLVRYRFPFGRFSRPMARNYTLFALPLALASLAGIFYSEIDKIMVGYFWSATDVGYYVAAQRIVYFLMVIPYATGLLIVPLMSELVAKNEMGKLHETMVKAQRLTSLVAFGGALLFIVYASEGIRIALSEAFLPATQILQLLTIQFALLSFAPIYSSVIFGFNRPAALAKVAVASSALNIALNALLIPTSLFGIPMLGLKARGAALATVFTQAAVLCMYVWMAKQLTGRFAMNRSTFKHGLAALAAGTLLFLSRSWPVWGGLDRFWELGIAGCIGLIIYLGILWILREVSVQDYRFFRDLFSPRQMAQYVREEMTQPPIQK